MKKLIPLVALTLTSMALVAEEDLITKLDSDNDARISIEEATVDASLSAMFAELDTNKDVYLTAQELNKYLYSSHLTLKFTI